MALGRAGRHYLSHLLGSCRARTSRRRTRRASQQLDVFFVDRNGQVWVDWVQPAPGSVWQGPHAISATHAAVPGGAIATGMQTPTQLDVFWIGPQDLLRDLGAPLWVNWVNWANGPGTWASDLGHGAPASISQSVFSPGAPLVAALQTPTQLDVVTTDYHGVVNVMAVSPQSNNVWQGPFPISSNGALLDTPANLAAFVEGTPSGNVLDVFYVDTSGTLTRQFVSGTGAWQSQGISPAGFAPAGAPVAASQQDNQPTVDAFVVSNASALNVNFEVNGGTWHNEWPIFPPQWN